MFAISTFQNKSSRYIMEVELNGEVFRLQFYWNAREEFWYMNILQSDDTRIVDGIKITPAYFLATQFEATPNMPSGDFLLADIESNPITGGVTFDNFGTRYILIFYTQEELEERGIR